MMGVRVRKVPTGAYRDNVSRREFTFMYSVKSGNCMI